MSRSRLRLLDLTPVLTPLWHIVSTDVPIGTTPAEVHSLALPSAGTYLVEIEDAFDAGTLTGSRNVFWTIGVTSFVSMSLTAIAHRTGVAHQQDITQTANNHQVGVTSVASTNRVRLVDTGLVVVSAAAVFTVQVFMTAETGVCRPGSFVKARRYA